MCKQILATSLALGLLIMILLLCAPILVRAQAPSGTATFKATVTDTATAIKDAAEAAKAAAAAASNWTPPRTPWGDPDLPGFYFGISFTPLVRSPVLEGKTLLSEAESLS